MDNILREIWFEHTRSRGPGGQNVNRTNSAAILKWHLESSRAFSDEQKEIIKKKLTNYINSEGLLYLRSDQHRDLEQNKKACYQRLHQLLQSVLVKARKRVKTKPTKSSVKKRLESKRKLSELKSSREKDHY